jgi:hypothetical protein
MNGLVGFFAWRPTQSDQGPQKRRSELPRPKNIPATRLEGNSDAATGNRPAKKYHRLRNSMNQLLTPKGRPSKSFFQ